MRRKTVVVLVVYLLVVTRITLWPQEAYGSTLDVVRTVVAWLSDRGLPVTYAGVEAVSNVLMFVPFGVLVGLLVRRLWVVVLLGCATSTAIELAQLAFLPSRFPTVQDVVMNTLGVVLGVVGLRLWSRRTTGRVPPEEDPARRGAADVSR